MMELVAQDMSASVIAGRMGITRNAVLGKLHRMRLERKRPTVVKSVPPRRKYAWRKPILITPAERIIIASPLDAAAVPIEQRRSILELQNAHCRFPYGNPKRAGFFYCGFSSADVLGGRPYCTAHARLCCREVTV